MSGDTSKQSSILELLAEESDRVAELEATAADMARLIRLLRPDLTATRERADRVLERYETLCTGHMMSRTSNQDAAPASKPENEA